MLILRNLFLAAGLCMATSALTARPAQAQTTITCESQNNQFRDCKVVTGGGVRLVQNISNTRCEYGRTWGFDWNSVWVDRGCRGRFMVNGSGTGWETGSYGKRVKCESQGGSYKICDVATYGYVRMVQQISQAPCIAGRTWGYQARQIWVGDGCRAEFEVGYGDSNWEGDARLVNCFSNDGRYSRCFARTEGQVTLKKQLSSQPCVLQRTWGYDRNGIWVDNGCRGQFVVGRGGPGSGWGEYPGTWPGPGSPGGGGNVQQRAGAACTNEARSRGYQNVSIDNTSQGGSMVYVYMRGVRNSREYTVGCQYSANSNRVQITAEEPMSGGGGGGGGSAVLQRGRDACSNKASSMGYQSVNVTNARQSGSNVTVAMTARNQNRGWNLTCVYRQSDKSVVMTEQSEAGGGGGGGGSGNLYADAKNACANQARRQGYQVLDYGSARPQSFGVKQNLVLTRGGLRYSGADCNYMVDDRTATVAPGNPDKQAK